MLLVGLLEISVLECHASRWLWRATTARTICLSSWASNWYLKPTGASSSRGLCGTTFVSVISLRTLTPLLILTILYAKRPPALGGSRLYCGRFLSTCTVMGEKRSSSYSHLHRPVLESRHGASSSQTCVMCCSTACHSTESHVHSSVGAAPVQVMERASERKAHRGRRAVAAAGVPQPQCSAGCVSRQRQPGSRHAPVCMLPRGGPGGRRALTYWSYCSGERGPSLRRMTMCMCGCEAYTGELRAERLGGAGGRASGARCRASGTRSRSSRRRARRRPGLP